MKSKYHSWSVSYQKAIRTSMMLLILLVSMTGIGVAQDSPTTQNEWQSVFDSQWIEQANKAMQSQEIIALDDSSAVGDQKIEQQNEAESDQDAHSVGSGETTQKIVGQLEDEYLFSS